MSSRRTRSIACALSAAAVLGGCGLGPGASPDNTNLVITQDFGTRSVLQTDHPHTGGSDTVMRMLERNAKVTTAYGGGFVQSIDGLSGKAGSAPTDWFYYVNGVEASKGAADTDLHAGDQVWWDRHDWQATNTIPAVVGAFPEPFLHGISGKREPTRIECAGGAAKACQIAQSAFTKAGIVAAQGGLETSFTKDTLRVLVGPWAALREDDAARQLEAGPSPGGVYAKVAPDGRSIAVLDDAGHVTRTLGAGAGLVAATRFQDGRPVWIVTGTDEAGIEAAAGALDGGNLHNRFAVAIDNDTLIPLPSGPAP